MNILLCGGVKTINIAKALKSLESEGINFIVEKWVENINDVYNRGEYFDRAVIIEQSFTRDGADTDGDIIRDRVSSFVKNQLSRDLNDVNYIFIVTNEEYAEIVFDETLTLNNTLIIVSKPPYNVSFFKGVVLNDFKDFPEDIVYKPKIDVEVDKVDNVEASQEDGIDSVNDVEESQEDDMASVDDVDSLVGDLFGDSADEDLGYFEGFDDDKISIDNEGNTYFNDNLDNGDTDFFDDTIGSEKDNIDIDSEGIDFFDDDLIGNDGKMSSNDEDISVEDEEDLEVEAKEDLGIDDEDNVSIEDSTNNVGIDIDGDNVKLGNDIDSVLNRGLEDNKELDNIDKNNNKVNNYDKAMELFDDENYSDEDDNSREEIELDNKDIKLTLRAFALRGSSIVVTGCGGCGTSTIAYNIANTIANIGYTVLLVDMDTYGRSQSYISKENYVSLDHHRYGLVEILKSSTDIDRYVSVPKPGLRLATNGLGTDNINLSDILKDTKIQRFMNLARSTYNFIVYDIPFNDAVGSASEILYNSDNLVVVIDTSNWGITKAMINISNIEDYNLMDIVFSSGQIILNKYRPIKRLMNKRVRKYSDILKIVDNKIYELIGDTPEYSFSDMSICGIVPYDDRFELGWYSNKQYSNTKEGNKIFTEILKNILLKLSVK